MRSKAFDFCVAFGLLLQVALVGPAVAQATSSAVADPAPTGPRAVAVEPTARDVDIQRRIASILEATGWFRDVAVRADDGVVFIDGYAETEARRRWAHELAASTQDVAAVVNRIEIDRADAWSLAPAAGAVERLFRDVAAAGPLAIFALVVLPVAWIAAGWVARFVRFLLSRRIESVFLRDVVARTAAVPVFLLGVYLVLQVAGLTQLAVSVLGGAGVLGIIVGFAFRDIAENFLASLLLSVRRPFQTGDYIDVDGRRGVVQSMNTRSTILVSLEGNHIQIPNAAIFKSVIVNYSAAPKRRETVSVGIGYDASVTEAQRVILGVLEGHDAVVADPEPLVLVDALGAATVNIKVYFWFDGATVSAIKLRSSLLRLMKKALVEHGVSMPDEAREVIFPEGVPLRRMDRGPTATTARTPPPAPTQERDDQSTEAEGGLDTELDDLQEQAAAGDIPEAKTDLLRSGP